MTITRTSWRTIPLVTEAQEQARLAQGDEALPDHNHRGAELFRKELNKRGDVDSETAGERPEGSKPQPEVQEKSPLEVMGEAAANEFHNKYSL